MKRVNNTCRNQNVIMAEESKTYTSKFDNNSPTCSLPKKQKLSSQSENFECTNEKQIMVQNKEYHATKQGKSTMDDNRAKHTDISGCAAQHVSTKACRSNAENSHCNKLSGTDSTRLVNYEEGRAGCEKDCIRIDYSEERESSISCTESISEVEENSSLKNITEGENKNTTTKDSNQQSSLTGEHASYRDLSLIGNGAYGTVYKAKDLTSGQFVALKKVRVPITEDGLPFSTLREIATLKQLERFEHPHIVKLLDVCQGNDLEITKEARSGNPSDHSLTLWLVFEHIEQDLASYISSHSTVGIPPRLVHQMSKEILLGVDFLHSHRIIHRDLKPQNLLVTRENKIKIADFGLAKTYDFEMRLTSVVVTLWYRAPEVLLGCTYATPVDIWSVGCILAELNRLCPLFPGSSEGDQLDRIFQVIGMPPKNQWPDNVSLSWTAFPQRLPKPLHSVIPNVNDEGLDLIKNTLTFNPHHRISAAKALQHTYFKDTVFL